MCTQARIPSGSRRNESASSKSFAVSGSIVNVVSSRRSTRPSRLGSGSVVRLELDARAAARRAAPRARSRSAARGPRPRSTRARPAARPDDGEVAALEVADPLRVEHDRHAGREVRLADDELAAPLDLDDDALRLVGLRGPRGQATCAADERCSRPARQTRRKRRSVSAGAERAERRGPSRAGSARSAGTPAPARPGRSRARGAGSPAARPPCRATSKNTASSGAAEPAEQPLDHERAADEPVRRADELHHLDLAAPREDREPDRVRDQQRRGDEQDRRRDREDRPRSRARPGGSGSRASCRRHDLRTPGGSGCRLGRRAPRRPRPSSA